MKYEIKVSNTFKKDVRLAQKRNLDLSQLGKVIDLLAAGQPLPRHCQPEPFPLYCKEELTSFSEFSLKYL